MRSVVAGVTVMQLKRIIFVLVVAFTTAMASTQALACGGGCDSWGGLYNTTGYSGYGFGSNLFDIGGFVNSSYGSMGGYGGGCGSFISTCGMGGSSSSSTVVDISITLGYSGGGYSSGNSCNVCGGGGYGGGIGYGGGGYLPPSINFGGSLPGGGYGGGLGGYYGSVGGYGPYGTYGGSLGGGLFPGMGVPNMYGIDGMFPTSNNILSLYFDGMFGAGNGLGGLSPWDYFGGIGGNYPGLPVPGLQAPYTFNPPVMTLPSIYPGTSIGGGVVNTSPTYPYFPPFSSVTPNFGTPFNTPVSYPSMSLPIGGSTTTPTYTTPVGSLPISQPPSQLPWGSCDNIIVMCPQGTVTRPPTTIGGTTTPIGTNPFQVTPEYQYIDRSPVRYRIPRGATHR